MLRPALTAGLMMLALAAPAAADGEVDRPAPAGYGRMPRPAYAPVRRYHRVHAGLPRMGSPHPGLRRGIAVRPVSYGEREGEVFHAWLPRNTNLPIYNIPPPFFPEH
ncbi:MULTISPECIES: hypothetical protein [Methylobacterium]|uniref:hypothetical protein n=1 Tax=Methylobacterium TaxID=407 RepID=UPI0013EDB42C|nr:hypothetical protein [Methylobacterium sp. DB0501]NGM37188.1 hypothetical protein [Methylobacterium sp. DB0501]